MIKKPTDKKIFSVSFFELQKITEMCWSCVTASDLGFIFDMIDYHYLLMTPKQRNIIHKQFQEKLKKEKGYYGKETEFYREMLVSRYNPYNHLIVNELFDTPMFYFNSRYWMSHKTTYSEKNIISLERIED